MLRVTVSSNDGKLTRTVANEIAALLESLKVGVTFEPRLPRESHEVHARGVEQLRGMDATIIASVGP
jgi:hypothetical protein